MGIGDLKVEMGPRREPSIAAKSNQLTGAHLIAYGDEGTLKLEVVVASKGAIAMIDDHVIGVIDAFCGRTSSIGVFFHSQDNAASGGCNRCSLVACEIDSVGQLTTMATKAVNALGDLDLGPFPKREVVRDITTDRTLAPMVHHYAWGTYRRLGRKSKTTA